MPIIDAVPQLLSIRHNHPTGSGVLMGRGIYFPPELRAPVAPLCHQNGYASKPERAVIQV
ncbi:MAG: hypothetical protein CMM16_04425 [Rhodospirillaceae bacterium]|nr:hypothetical protein [Rhodospirillaceae bacterium]